MLLAFAAPTLQPLNYKGKQILENCSRFRFYYPIPRFSVKKKKKKCLGQKAWAASA